MPIDIVNIDKNVDAGSIPQPTFNDVCVVGASTTAPTGANFGEVNRYSNSSDVADDYGDDADVAIASDALEQMGADEWRVVVFEATEHDAETVADGDQLANTPVWGEYDVTLSTDDDIVWSTKVAADQNPDAGEVAINAAEGDVSIGDGTDVDISYATVDWSLSIIPSDVDLVGFADVRMTRQHIGDLDALVTWASGENNGVVAAHQDGRNAVDDETALETAHDVGGYVPSGDLLTIAHKSGDDVAAYVLGQLATNDPWFNPFYDGDGYPFNSENYKSALVGDPATPGTFEGGKADPEGEGATNVVISKAGTTVLSNSQTTAGPASSYQFFDVGRTEAFTTSEIERALVGLRLSEDRIPFQPVGQSMIESEIKDVLDPVVGGVDDPLASIDVEVPDWDDLSDTDRENRVWPGIMVRGRLSGDTHEFGVELALQA